MVWDALTSCFKDIGEDKSERSKRPNCVFCSTEGLNVISENDEIIIFKDRSPAAQEHLLVIPREHILSAKALTRDDLPLVRRLETAGKQALADLGYPEDKQRLGFHIPPFNSINHLHLHAQGLPYKGKFQSWKYPYFEGKDKYVKSWGWFITADQAIAILEKGANITVRSC